MACVFDLRSLMNIYSSFFVYVVAAILGLKQYKYPSANYTFALPCTRKTPCQPCATGTPLQEEDSWSAVAITKQGESPLITELNALVTARQAIPHPTISTANPSIAHHSLAMMEKTHLPRTPYPCGRRGMLPREVG